MPFVWAEFRELRQRRHAVLQGVMGNDSGAGRRGALADGAGELVGVGRGRLTDRRDTGAGEADGLLHRGCRRRPCGPRGSRPRSSGPSCQADAADGGEVAAASWRSATPSVIPALQEAVTNPASVLQQPGDRAARVRHAAGRQCLRDELAEDGADGLDCRLGRQANDQAPEVDAVIVPETLITARKPSRVRISSAADCPEKPPCPWAITAQRSSGGHRGWPGTG